MKILVTGGAGYIGTELVDELARSEEVEEVIVYDNLSRKNRNLFLGSRLPAGKVRFVLGDILDTRRLGASLDGVDVVFHLAAMVRTPFTNEDHHGLDQVNHWGSAELSYLLEARPVRRLVYLSSASVYGAPTEMATIDSPTKPKAAYGVSKLAGERMFSRLADDMEVLIVRSANVYGYSRSMRFDAVINRFMFDAHHLGRITVHGNGEQRRAFIHIENLTRCLLGLADGESKSGIYNAAGRNCSIGDVEHAIQEVYPEVESLYVDQDLTASNLTVESDGRLNIPGEEAVLLVDQLRAFEKRFSFEGRAS